MTQTIEPERHQIPAHRRWRTEHLYRSDAAWERQRKRLLASLGEIAAQRGKLRGSSAATLACLERAFAARRLLGRLVSYASRRNDEDTRQPRYQAMKEVIDKASAELSTATAFIEPELLALRATRLRALAADPRFADYDRYLLELLRCKEHILGPKEEALLARFSLVSDSGNTVYETFSSADLTFPEIRDEQGARVRLTQALFSRYRASKSRRVRQRAFGRFFGTFERYRNTFAALLSAQVNANIVQARARRYAGALEAALDPDEIDRSVYHRTIEAAHRHLPLLHRYLDLRRRALGLRRLRYHDLYPPMIERVRFKIPYEEGCRILCEALAPLGPRYVKALSRGLEPRSGWVDPMPNRGKRSGAYMDGSAYDVHPYVLANYLDDFNSLSTIAHEMGHAMHSCYSNRHQPYAKADYAIFVAEVASTLNEDLLCAHLTERSRGKRRLFLLGEQLEGFRQTFFRQAMFAEFELEVYRTAERDEALTADKLSELYLAIARRYYGHDEGVVEVEPAYAIEWAYVPHFYYNFYVFQYATGITAATALAEGIRAEGSSARDRYIDRLLKAGDSAPPIEILRQAGVDLTEPAPYDLALSVMSRALDELSSALG